MRGVKVLESDPVPTLVKRLKRKEGIFKKIARKKGPSSAR